MSLALLLPLASLIGSFPLSDPRDGWIADGARLCMFDTNIGDPPSRCMQYHQVVTHKLEGGQVWKEYRWLWKDGKSAVQYVSRIGTLGVSSFTIGEIVYGSANGSDRVRRQAVSYAASREELVIGIPGDDYQFAMKGAM